MNLMDLLTKLLPCVINFTFLWSASYGKKMTPSFSPKMEPLFERKNSPARLASAEDKTYNLDELHLI